MSSKMEKSDSMGGEAQRGSKRINQSASQQLCKNKDCEAFEKALGNGYCQDCCFSRGVPFKAPKKQLFSSETVNQTLSNDHFEKTTKVLVCTDVVCVIGSVDAIFREKATGAYFYNVTYTNSGSVKKLSKITACDVRKYTDASDYPSWPPTALHMRTLVHGLSRSIGFSSPTTLKTITPFGNIAGVSVDSDGNPVHYFVLCSDATSRMEGRVVRASDVVLYEPAPTPPSSSQFPPADAYFLNKTTQSVLSVSFHELKKWILGKGLAVGEQLTLKDDLVQLMVHENLEYDVHFSVSEEDFAPPKVDHQPVLTNEYQTILNSLSADHFLQGSPVRSDLEGDKGSPPPTIVPTPSKKTSPLGNRESALLSIDTANVMKTFEHRAQLFPSLQEDPALLPIFSVATALEDDDVDIYLQMGIDVQSIYISDDMGYGIFMMRDIPVDTLVTTYDGPRVDSRTGEVIFECPFTHSIETKYTANNQFTRSRKWGDYEREHCVLLEHSNDVCIDGTFSSQPFLFHEGFHGGTGFGASFNSGRGEFVNMKKCYKRSSRLPRDPNGQRDQVFPNIAFFLTCVTVLQICYFRTTRAVLRNEELLWNFKPIQNYKYKEFNVTNPQLSFSNQSDFNIPNVPLPLKKVAAREKKEKVAKNKTPSTVLKAGGGGGGGGAKAQPALGAIALIRPAAFVPDLNPYGDGLGDHGNDEAQSDSDGNDVDIEDSEQSAQSSDDDDATHVRPQPVYPEYCCPILDKKRKVQINWDVQNVVSSDVAANSFVGSTKLNWRTIGLNNSSTRPKTELEYFLLMDVPVTALVNGQSILGLTNAAIREDPQRRGSDLSKLVLCRRFIFPASCVQCRGEWYKMIGVLLAHNLEHVNGAFGSMWNKEEKPGMISRPPNFGERFGVSLNR
jgi:hypothetical protein